MDGTTRTWGAPAHSKRRKMELACGERDGGQSYSFTQLKFNYECMLVGNREQIRYVQVAYITHARYRLIIVTIKRM
jgi:hypothetical protein